MIYCSVLFIYYNNSISYMSTKTLTFKANYLNGVNDPLRIMKRTDITARQHGIKMIRM